MIVIPKNRKEEVRISVDTFKGHQLVNMRVWFEAEDGQMRPGKQGVAVKLDLVPELVSAIQEVVRSPGGG